MDTKAHIRRILQIAGLGLAIILQNCQQAPTDFVRDNPFDSGGDNFITLVTTLVSVPQGIIDTTSFRFSWVGSSELLEFSYRLDDHSFSAWSSDTAATLEYLDEGDHIFEVKSRYSPGVEEDSPAQIDFTVDAVQPGSIVLYPYSVEAEAGDTLTIELRADEIVGLTVLDCTFEYDTTTMVPILDSAESGSFLSKDGGTTILFTELNPYLSISIGVAQGPVDGVSGSGSIAIIQFRALSSGTILLSDNDLRGPNDEGVELVSVRGTIITIVNGN